MDVFTEKDTDMVTIEGIEKQTLLTAVSLSENEKHLVISEESCLPKNNSLSDKETWLTKKTASTISCKKEKIDSTTILSPENEYEKEKNMTETTDNNNAGKSIDTEKSFQNLSEPCHRFERVKDKSLQLETKNQFITEQLSKDKTSVDKNDTILSTHGFHDGKQSEKNLENKMNIQNNMKLSCDSDDYSDHNKSHTFVKAADVDSEIKPDDLHADIGEEGEAPKQNDEDSNAAVMIESSSDEEDSEITSIQLQMREEHIEVIDRATSDDDCESISFHDDEDEYEDDLMNVVCTSASNNLTKKRSRSLSSNYDVLQFPISAHQTKKLEQICMTRTVNYAIIAKKRSSKWLNNSNKREFYRSALRKKILKKNLKKASVENKNTYVNSKQTYYNEVPISPKTQETVIMHYPENKQHLTLPSSEVIDLDSSPEKCTTFEQYISENLLIEPGMKDPQDFKDPSSGLDKKLTNNSKNENKNSHLNKATPISLNKDTNKENVNSNDKNSDAGMINPVSDHQNLVLRNDASDYDLENDNQIFQSQKTGNFLHETVANANDALENRISGKTIPDIESKQANESNENTDFESRTEYQSPQTYLSKEKDSKRYSPSINKTILNSIKGEKCSEQMNNCTRKLRDEIQLQYSNHDIINEYIDKTSSNSADEIGRHVTQLISEIQTLNELIKTKESEWNNMLHIKKIKEEICVRLVRRKQVIELLASKISEFDKTNESDNGTLQNFENCNPVSSTPNVGVQSNTQRIIQNRANMNSSDLAKEKLNTQRLHRNILPVSGNSMPLSSIAKNTKRKQFEVAGSSVVHTEGPSLEQPTVLNNYLSSTENIQQLIDIMNEHQFSQNSRNGEFSNVNQNIQQMVGRQGPFKDVKSIIADFRQKHPEITPRRGRRVKKQNANLLESSYNILGNALKIDMNSRPSSNDSSSHSTYNSNLLTSGNISNTEKAKISVSVKDFLEPLLKSSEQMTADALNSITMDTSVNRTLKDFPIHQQDPQITLHPVGNSHSLVDGVDQPSGSLLHGILTKYTQSAQATPFTKSSLQYHQQQGTAGSNYISNFSPTLARLLTNPEKVSSAPAKNNSHRQSSACTQNSCFDGVGNSGINVHSIPNFGTNFSKVIGRQNGEVTITPVVNSTQEPSILQQQLQQQQQLKAVLTKTPGRKFNEGKGNCLKKEQNFIKLAYIADNEDGDDSIGRLVIDEGNESVISEDQQPRIALQTVSREINENEVPLCQGCRSHEAQFVCAGCGNQWYCSRECQVAAWDDHSEVCTG